MKKEETEINKSINKYREDSVTTVAMDVTKLVGGREVVVLVR